MLLINTQVSKLGKAFANNSSANMKLSKPQSHKIGQLEEFLGRLLGPLPKTGLPLMKHVLKPLTKSVLILLELTKAASSTDAATHKKMFRSGTTISIISSDEMNAIIKIVKSLEESGLLIKSLSEAIENKAKEQKDGFFRMLLGTLGASLLGNLLIGKDAIREGEDVIRAGHDF